VVGAEPERKVWKEVRGDIVQAAQLPAKERDENASAVSGLWSGGIV